jgi:hypothetical protein
MALSAIPLNNTNVHLTKHTYPPHAHLLPHLGHLFHGLLHSVIYPELFSEGQEAYVLPSWWLQRVYGPTKLLTQDFPIPAFFQGPHSHR